MIGQSHLELVPDETDMGLLGTSITPHSLGLHKVLKHLTPLIRPMLEYLPNRRLDSAVNIADLRLCAEKVCHESDTDSKLPQH